MKHYREHNHINYFWTECAIYWQYYDVKFNQYIPIYHQANISLRFILKQHIWSKTMSEIPKKKASLSGVQWKTKSWKGW